MFRKFHIPLLCCLVLATSPAWSSAHGEKLDDFLTNVILMDDERPCVKTMFKGVSFPGTTQTLFSDLVDVITTLSVQKKEQFPYGDDEMMHRFTLLKHNFLSKPPESESEMQKRISYFALMHYGQLESTAPDLASRLKRVEKEIAFSVFPTQKEVLWLFPETCLSGMPRAAFVEFLDLLFERFDQVKQTMNVTNMKEEKAFLEKVRLRQVSREQLTSAGWPAHSPASIVIGWFCLYDRLKNTKDEEEQYAEIAQTINLHKTALEKMNPSHKEKLPAFMCDACKGTALYMNGIEPDKKEAHQIEPCTLEENSEG